MNENQEMQRPEEEKVKMPTKKCKHCNSEIDKQAKVCPVCHSSQSFGAGKIVALVAIGIVVIFVLGSCIANIGKTTNTSSSSSSQATQNEQKTYGAGENWTVDGQWNFRIDSVTATDDRNQFSDKNPAQVVIITYTYENLGYTSKIQDLYFSSSEMSVIDANNAIASTYPVATTVSPQPVPVGTTCNAAEEGFGLDNASQQVTIKVSKYDANSKKQEATFVVPIQ